MDLDSLSLTVARRLRGGRLPHIAPPVSPRGAAVRLTLDAPPEAAPEAVLTDPRREHPWRVALGPAAGGGWETTILLPREPTLLRYHFVLAGGAVIRESRQREGTSERLFGVWEDRDFQIAVYDPAGAPPDWVAGSVMYQIFPDRFAQGDPANIRRRGPAGRRPRRLLPWDARPEHPSRGRDFFGGDLRGVIDKLDYLRDLGVSILYFTPIFASPSNHRYDAVDYLQIDPRLGTEADLRELISEAGARGMRVLLDGVFNHCSDRSIYFRAARADRQSPYYRWFDFEQWPDRWVGWAGVTGMPEFVECPEVEEFFLGPGGVALHWLALGTAGWRTDVTPWMTDEFWRRFRRAVRRADPLAYLIAEDWGDSTGRLLGDTFDATMNYRFGYSVAGFAGGRLSAAELDDRLETLRRDTPPGHFHAQMNLLGSHDTARIRTLLGAPARVRLAAALQLAYPGVPMVYYGDEAGVEGDYAEAGRRPYPWAAPDAETLAFYRLAINARRGSPALSRGDVRTVWVDEAGGYGFLRENGAHSVLAIFNASEAPREAVVALGPDAPAGAWTDLLGGLPEAQVADGALSVILPPLGAAWFQAPPGG
jgi:cyclomaltodextrinase / maltogenic alpha-amylase / neopullulanase